MAKSIELQLLFASAMRSPAGQRLPWHAHPYWQCERVEQGVLELHHADGAERLERGMSVLIPPGVQHALYFPVATTSSTVKFAGPEAGVAIQSFAASEPCSEIASLLHRHALAEIQAGQSGLLQALLACAGETAPAQASSPGLAGRIQQAVRHSYQMNHRPICGVTDCAQRVGYSPSHCAAAFRAATGEALKSWIDEQRAVQAEGLLRFSDEDLAGIAHALAFPDANAFSRFFSRLRGLPPGRWRRRWR